MTTPPSDPGGTPELLKMSVFAARAGVPAATIKHYIREKLLPEPHRTSRTMAYYDAALIPRVRAIKRMQRDLYLPLPVIREVLVEVADADDLEELAMSVAIRRVLDQERGDESRTRSDLLASGMSEEILEGFKALGIVTPEVVDDEETYAGDDLVLLRTLKQARAAGLSPDMLPASILADYMGAIANLVRVELRLFSDGVIARATSDAELVELSTTATRLSERLVVLLRRKLLLPTLQQLFAEAKAKPEQ